MSETKGTDPETSIRKSVIRQPLAAEGPVYSLNNSNPENPELFLISGLTGQVFPFKRTARLIADKLQVTGLLFPHLAGETDRYTTIVQTAEYFHGIVAASKREPIFVLGYSKGGAIAFELASRLSNEGVSVGLILFDTSVRVLQKQKHPVRFLLQDISGIIQRFVRRQSAYLKKDAIEHARLDSIAALRKYRPEISKVPTVLIRPNTISPNRKFVEIEDLGWGQVTNLCGVLRTDGHHDDAFRGDYALPFSKAISQATDILKKQL
jgi:pimeloyl-ACP methyl ester carboxylesterase